MRKDVLDDKYARLYELPTQLFHEGHDVIGVCLSYRKKNQGVILKKSDNNRNFEWHSYNLFSGGLRYIRSLFKLIKDFKPDILIGSSDAIHIIFTRWLARRFRINYALDLYDNFESFGLTRIPGFLPLYRQAVRDAAVVSCVSQPLADYIKECYQPIGSVMVLESTVNTDFFFPRDKSKARTVLGLPQQSQLIGIAGALTEKRGLNVLYEAYAQLSQENKEVELVLAGKADNSLPQGKRIHYLGELSYDKIPLLWSALDVAVICVQNTAFGRYSFPQKTYEIMACKTPMVAAAVGAMQNTLASCSQCLYEAENAESLLQKLKAQLDNPQVPTLEVPTWQVQAKRLGSLLESV